MPIPSNPTLLSGVIGEAADVLPIPAQDYTDPTQNGALNYKTGWPAITALPLEAGGKAPRREYFNAWMQLMSSHTFFQQSGSLYPWSATLDYLTGAHVLGSDGNEYIAQKSNGPDVPDSSAVDPVGDESGTWLPAGSVYAPLATPDTPGIVQPDGTTCTVENGLLTALGVNKLYDLKDRDLSLYVRPDGSDENDGLANTPERAWATIDHAVEWINERRFTGAGWITVKVADGTYTATGKRPPLACYDAQFANSMASFPNCPTDPVNAQMAGSARVRIVGNVSNKAAVRYVIPSSLPLQYFVVSGCGVYGMTLAIEPGDSSQIRGTVVYSSSVASGYIANCTLEAGPDTGVVNSPFCAFRGSGNLTMYGDIIIRASSDWNPNCIWWPENGAYYNFGHFASNMAGSGAIYTETLLNCTIETSVSGCISTYYASQTGAPTTGFVKVTGSQISWSNPSGYRFSLNFPNIFFSNGLGLNFFPGAQAGVASIPTSLYS